MKKVIKIATRSSPLAVWQAEFVKQGILKKYPELNIELIKLTTSGDKFLADRLLAVGNKGLFVKELEQALLEHRADIAVHSMKDLLNVFPEGLELSTILKRHNPNDALVCPKYKTLSDLPINASVGTSSLRRQAQLLRYRPDLRIMPVRGNIQTRLDKLRTTPFDAIILAAAGLERMALSHEITQILPMEVMLPAAAQGALGIECRIDDHQIKSFIKHLSHKPTTQCVQTERLVNHYLGGSCHTPVAIHCKHIGQDLALNAEVLSVDGQKRAFFEGQGQMDKAETLAKHCAESLLQQGAHKMIQIS